MRVACIFKFVLISTFLDDFKCILESLRIHKYRTDSKGV